MNILARFHQEKTVFDETRADFLILLFYKAPTRASEGLLWKKSIKFDVDYNMMILKVKKFKLPRAPQIFLLVTSS